MSDKINVYDLNLCCASVCVPKDMPLEDVINELNAEHPTGIKSQWELEDAEFHNGKANPHPCYEDDTRVHYLFAEVLR